MNSIQKIDERFSFGSITKTDLNWLTLDEKAIHIYGTPNNEKVLTRIESDRIQSFPEGIQILGLHTSGVRIRFKTNTKYFAFKAILSSKDTMPHMADTGISGFDVYVRVVGEKEYRYQKTFTPDLGYGNPDTRPVVVGECYFWSDDREKDILIHFPLYNGVEDVVVGIEEEATLSEPTPYTIEKPILFYGSSITQGGCASRPGNSYPLLLSRWLDADMINFGFSGNAKGEQIVAEYISEKGMSALVIDYDHNAPTLQDLEETYEPFFKYIRKAHPSLPMVMISKPDFDGDVEGHGKRRQVIYNTYMKAKTEGDANIYFIDGATLFGERGRGECTVDGCHPNDLGFMRMAETIYPVLREALDHQLLYHETNAKPYTIPFINLDQETKMQVVVDREVGQYLGHPTTVLLEDQKTMWTVYPKGHGAGAIILKKSEDAGKTWSTRLETPKSWEESKETPILYEIETPQGIKRLLMVSGIVSGTGGFRISYSDDQGITWSEFKTYYDQIGVQGIVAFATLVRLKKPNGEWDYRWMGLFHDREYKNYKVILSFDESGQMVCSMPEAYLGQDKVVKTYTEDGLLLTTTIKPQNYRSIEMYAGLCEPCALRSPDGKQLAVIFRGNTKVTSSMVIFSDDEGETWSKPKEVAGALRGERHQAKYDCVTGKLLVTFRSYGITGNPDDRHWVAWLGQYEDLVNGTEGDCRICLKKNIGTVSWNGNDGDCGYAGIEQITDIHHEEYGTYILTSYGHWDKDEVNQEPYILTVRFKLDEIYASI
ncbi:MAG: SGNH/GDSL hydrolase family protein [Niameybacter sp.]|uniref:SGNH/GDSL hydrolase family protein n=2 Tax=Niameybacter sp. TaxID=2033640 RepID=UPI002FCC6F76